MHGFIVGFDGNRSQKHYRYPNDNARRRAEQNCCWHKNEHKQVQGAMYRYSIIPKFNIYRSSRSHQLLMLRVEGYDHVSKTTSHGRLTLVDLAGSERISRSEATGIRLVEAASINKSLSALGQVYSYMYIHACRWFDRYIHVHVHCTCSYTLRSLYFLFQWVYIPMKKCSF